MQLKPIVAELNSNALLREVIRRADEANLKRIYAEVSITAKSFFEKQGFKMITEQQVQLRGVALTNFLMEMRREKT